MKELFANVPLRHLEPRECLITAKPTLLSTILGSCLALTVFDPTTKVGGMTHAFLPTIEEYPDDQDVCKFVDSSIMHMFAMLKRKNVDIEGVEIKLFGGGEVLTASGDDSGRLSVGRRNVETALQELSKGGLRITASDTGGRTGRKLLFLTHTGGAWVKKLHKHADGKIRAAV